MAKVPKKIKDLLKKKKVIKKSMPRKIKDKILDKVLIEQGKPGFKRRKAPTVKKHTWSA